ncbi:Hypothetical predicted protein [Mytilus galloprovincialis]|uniref:Uncharacterized protein n=1 Tax=Mytilus galloprovincialis TaxID=29158 RepID=A0A8B6GZI6_MYTGA|nr:Hypothetical predicted protein [Mytilus galloprovincialis]
MYTQAIWKICQGCSDKEAGQHGATARPTSVEAAIDQIKWFQHNHTAIFGKPTGRRDPTPNQDEPSYDYDSDLAVHAIGKTDTKSELSKQMETLLEKMTAMEALHKQEIGDLKQQFQKTTAGKTVSLHRMKSSQQPNHLASKPTSKVIANNGVTEIIGKITSVNHHLKGAGDPIPPEKLANMACYFCHQFGHIQRRLS